ncbi:MAG: hypothetical protein ABS99_10650 [Acetobacteraceae bacterium SCN 69-10]|nr:hypothetical protein [Rhodospirillales bacterium]ODU53757.1 MAG: hypothetical protein ABS99_10650 [Acetobacteraceae bacterium SCN 69-10]OJY64781.1 MAG: hypothetical protein BGP12_03280 [Rhodospirillales bacterium 70-18]
MRPIMMLLAAPLLLAACATSGAAEANARLAAYVGMSEADLVRSVGAPTSTSASGEHKYLAYNRTKSEWEQASPFNRNPPQLLGLDYNGLPPRLLVWSCETTFDIVGGKVAGASQRGNYCAGTV